MKSTPLHYIQKMYGDNAAFRDGQFEAITELAEKKSRLLLVQRTGWGKSIVYFIATRMLRDQGAGPAILISPLLSLMRNQIAMVEKIDFLHTARIDSSNQKDWKNVNELLKADQLDMLLISPERLANQQFMQDILPTITKGIGFFIVDEAHCISDWGHDFRPDYRRIVRVMNLLPRNIPILATTATANNRVISDIQAQLGANLKIMRGPLGRESLILRNIKFENRAERLAWLVYALNKIKGSGIIYCLTVRDTDRVAQWLRQNNIDAKPYHADLDNDTRESLEQDLVHNRIKALVATVALGMGFDKPDLSFVIHFQKPGSVIHYYQQVGRAGRALTKAHGILLHAEDDDKINEYFIKDAFPPVEIQRAIVSTVEKSGNGMTIGEIQKEVNLRYGKIDEALRMLEIDGALSKNDKRYYRSLHKWDPDIERKNKVTMQRELELKRMNDYVNHSGCLMKFLCDELDDPQASECGKCAPCRNVNTKKDLDVEILKSAYLFMRNTEYRVINSRKFWPAGIKDPSIRKKIDSKLIHSDGRSLCSYGDPGLGKLVSEGKYMHQNYGDELLDASVDFIFNNWQPDPFPEWVTAIPSGRTHQLVPSFAQRLASKLKIPFKMVLRKKHTNELQKKMNNSYQQCKNLLDAFEICELCPAGTVLLVDDITDSGWTMTIAGIMLRENGCGSVIPFTLAAAPSKGES